MVTILDYVFNIYKEKGKVFKNVSVMNAIEPNRNSAEADVMKMFIDLENLGISCNMNFSSEDNESLEEFEISVKLI